MLLSREDCSSQRSKIWGTKARDLSCWWVSAQRTVGEVVEAGCEEAIDAVLLLRTGARVHMCG